MPRSDGNRIWELDALRGLCILCMIILHGMFDLRYFSGIFVGGSPMLSFVQQYGGVLFVLISGICVTLGTRARRRGMIVLSFGLVLTVATMVLSAVGIIGSDAVIRFGILHLLGVCMLLSPLFRRLPPAALVLLGLAFILLGFFFETLTVKPVFLYALGLRANGFVSGDYFPIFPNLGWYLIGMAVGATVYQNRTSRLPNATYTFPILRFCGRHSLVIYLVHQPILYFLLPLVP